MCQVSGVSTLADASFSYSGIGGWAAGVLADRYGRARVLQLTVLWFAVFTFLSGFTHSFAQLFFTRAMQGFGFGGEWAVGERWSVKAEYLYSDFGDFHSTAAVSAPSGVGVINHELSIRNNIFRVGANWKF